MEKQEIRKYAEILNKSRNIDEASAVICDKFINNNEIDIFNASNFLRKFTNKDFAKTFSKEITTRLNNQAEKTNFDNGRMEIIDVDTFGESIVFYESLRKMKLSKSDVTTVDDEKLSLIHKYIKEGEDGVFWESNIKNHLAKIGIENMLIDRIPQQENPDQCIHFYKAGRLNGMTLNYKNHTIHPMLTRDLDSKFSESNHYNVFKLLCSEVTEFKEDCLKSIEIIVKTNEDYDRDTLGMKSEFHEKLLKRYKDIKSIQNAK